MTRRLATLGVAAAALLGGAPPVGADAPADGCPSSNPPNMLRLADGSPQTAQLGKQFQTNLQVALANSNGCPVTGSLAGIPVDFVAPSSGASGTFASSGANVVTVGTNNQALRPRPASPPTTSRAATASTPDPPTAASSSR